MKPGEYGWVQSHASGFYTEPVKVKVLETGCSGIHSVKAITESGAVHYCKPDQIKSRPGKAMKAEPAIPAEVKAKAEKIADQKIKEFKEKKAEEKKTMEIITEKQAAERKERKNKATFEEVAKAFASLAKASDLEDEHPELSLVVNLATEQVKAKYAGGWE